MSLQHLSCFHDTFSNFPVCPIFRPRLLGRYFNAFNAIDNHNRILKSDLALEKYWVTHSDYFRLVTTVELGMEITYGKLLF